MNYGNPGFELQCAIEDKDVTHVEQVILKHKDFLNAVCLGDDQTPLDYACMLGYADIVKFLLEKGADVNLRMGEDGETAVFQAASKNKLEVVKLLIEYGARIKVRNYYGYTPLDCINSEDDEDDDCEKDVEGLKIMSEYLQECLDKEDSWYDEDLIHLAN